MEVNIRFPICRLVCMILWFGSSLTFPDAANLEQSGGDTVNVGMFFSTLLPLISGVQMVEGRGGRPGHPSGFYRISPVYRS